MLYKVVYNNSFYNNTLYADDLVGIPVHYFLCLKHKREAKVRGNTFSHRDCEQ